MTTLAIVTVLYRSRELLTKTLPTWARSADGLDVRFVFVDNDPADGCAETIAENLRPETYEYLPDATNPGFAAGCNRAVAAAGDATHVFLLNPDVWLAEDTLTALLRGIDADPHSPIAVGLAMHGQHYAGIDLNPISLFIDRLTEQTRGALGPSGGAAVFPTDLFRRFGGFYEYLFAWGEDADLAFRLYAAGVRTRVAPLSLPHASGHSVEGDRGLSAFRAYLLARNRLLVTARSLTWPLLLLVAPLLAVSHCALALRRAQQGLLRPFLRGLGRGVLAWPAARRSWRGERFGVRCLLAYLRDRRALWM